MSKLGLKIKLSKYNKNNEKMQKLWKIIEVMYEHLTESGAELPKGAEDKFLELGTFAAEYDAALRVLDMKLSMKGIEVSGLDTDVQQVFHEQTFDDKIKKMNDFAGELSTALENYMSSFFGG